MHVNGMDRRGQVQNEAEIRGPSLWEVYLDVPIMANALYANCPSMFPIPIVVIPSLYTEENLAN